MTRDEILAAGVGLSLQAASGRLEEINFLGAVSVNANSSHLSFFCLLNGNWVL